MLGWERGNECNDPRGGFMIAGKIIPRFGGSARQYYVIEFLRLWTAISLTPCPARRVRLVRSVRQFTGGPTLMTLRSVASTGRTSPITALL